MPTPEGMEVEEAGITYFPGLRSPINGKPLVLIDMDVIVQRVKNVGDPLDDDETFVTSVGNYLAKRLTFVLITVETQRLIEDFGDLESAATDAMKMVLDQIRERPTPKMKPYAGILRFAGDSLHVYFVGDENWTLKGEEGLARYFSTKAEDRKKRLPDQIDGVPLWTGLRFCKHRECLEPGCPCVCHDDGRNKLFDCPLVDFASKDYSDLLLRWSYVVETICAFLQRKAESDGRFYEAHLGQSHAMEMAFEWVVLETWDANEHIAMGVLNLNMFHLTKAFINF